MKREDDQIWDFFCDLKKAYSGSPRKRKQRTDGAGVNCPDCSGIDRVPHIQPMVAAAIVLGSDGGLCHGGFHRPVERHGEGDQ